MREFFGALLLFIGAVVIVFVSIVLSIFMILGRGLLAAALVVFSALILLPSMNLGARLLRRERWKKPLGYTLRLSGWVTLTFSLAFLLMAYSIGVRSVPDGNSRSLAVALGLLMYLVIGGGTAWTGSRLLELERAARPFQRPPKPPAHLSAPRSRERLYSDPDGEDDDV